MDDSGYFSVQVISNALKNLELDLVPYTSSSPIAINARMNPIGEKAFICNYKGHWFTIRKIGNQWFNLNSTLKGPELLSDLYVAEYLAQLIEEGYSIFIVVGELPPCLADDILMKNPIRRPKSVPVSNGHRLGTKEEDRARVLSSAKLLSAVNVPLSTPKSRNDPDITFIENRKETISIKIESDDEDNGDLQRALKMSLEDHVQDKGGGETGTSILNDHNIKKPTDLNKPSTSDDINDEEDDELRRALQMSLECITAPQTPDQEEIRWRRLAYHNNIRSQSGETSRLNT